MGSPLKEMIQSEDKAVDTTPEAGTDTKRLGGVERRELKPYEGFGESIFYLSRNYAFAPAKGAEP